MNTATRVWLDDDDLDDHTITVLDELLDDGIPVVLEQGPNGTVFIVEPHSNLDLGRCVPLTGGWNALAYPHPDGDEPWRWHQHLHQAVEHVATNSGRPDPTGTHLTRPDTPSPAGALT